MKPPKTIYVAPSTYDIKSDGLMLGVANAAGATLADDLTILYDERRPDDVIRDVLLHESLHAIWKQTYLRFKFDDDGDKSAGESIISELTPRLISLLRDNPKLVEYLLEGT